MNNIEWNFRNKVVFIVGSSRGIGLGVASAFEKSGANVIKLDSSICDISSKIEIDSFVKNLEKVDILINVAAINHAKKIQDISFEEWNEVLDVNLRGYFYVTKKVLEIMKDGGKIINVSSIAGRHRSVVSGAHYTSSKAGIIGLTRQIAYEVGHRSINVNVVCPSQTSTDMLKQSMTKEEIEQLASKIPLKRIATVEEQVFPIMFLSSNEASYITGAALDVNGGQL